jgi:hypothetical protein
MDSALAKRVQSLEAERKYDPIKRLVLDLDLPLKVYWGGTMVDSQYFALPGNGGVAGGDGEI